MSNTTEPGDKTGVKKGGWLRRRLVPILTILLVIVISVALFVLTQRYPEMAEKFEGYGYVGVFFVSLITSGTVIVPVPPILVLFPIVVTYNPFLVGLVGATGGIIGEITGYMAGYGGQGMVNKGKMYLRVEGWMKKWGSWIIFVFAAFLIFDVAGVVAGALRFPLWKFLLVGWIGKCIKYVGLMWLAVKGWEWVLHFFG
ncbi:MAG: VTT domain-containing protein [Dehalococcoidales bacterium]|nr:VTT domain-containing protein [Dehalococcoidales bacterium]